MITFGKAWAGLKRCLVGFFSLLAVLAVAFGSGWLGELLLGLLLRNEWGGRRSCWVATGSGLLFVVGSIFLYHQRKALFGTRNFGTIKPAPHRCVLFFLSTETAGKLQSGLEWPIEFPQKDNTSVSLTGESLETDVEIANKYHLRWNWIPLLRGLLPHVVPICRLERIVVFGSCGNGGSAGQLEAARQFIEHYLPDRKGVTIKRVETKSFEDFDSLRSDLLQEIRELLDEGYRPHDIVVDATGGQKPTSIAAASATLNSKSLFQYVRTNPPYDVIAYNLQHDVPWDD